MPRLTVTLAAALLAAVAAHVPAAAAEEDGIALLLNQLETALQSRSDDALDDLVSPRLERERLSLPRPSASAAAITGAVVRERDRTEQDEDSAHLVLEVFLEYEHSARMLTWQATVIRDGTRWRIDSAQTVASVEGLHRLQLDATRQFRANDLRVAAEDFELVLARGDVFLCRAPGGVTGLVLLGRGEMVFQPYPETEKRQLELFNGRPILRVPFRAAFVRVHPADYANRLSSTALTEVDVVPRTLAAAQQVFRVESVKSFAVDLGEVSREAWSLLPPRGDFLAEVRTTRLGTLTYVHTGDEPEDISLFDRARRRNISVYASRDRLARRGLAYSEDDEAAYDITDYNVDVTLAPDRLWLDGRSSIRVRTRVDNVSTLPLRLNSALAVRAVSSPEHGRLLFLRVRNQNGLVVNLPTVLARGTELTISVTYSGRLEPQPPESEAALGQPGIPFAEPETALVYSNRSYWYPQSRVTDYATSSIRLTLPMDYSAVCSGTPAQGSPVTVQQPERRIFVFTSQAPVRYLGCAVSRFTHREGSTLDLSTLVDAPPVPGNPIALRMEVVTTPRLRGRARDLLTRLEDVARFYSTTMRATPYPQFSLAVIESLRPGGHSPPYFAAYNQPLPGAAATWTTDPTSFDDYPEFFMAHEIAHQWWGHAVGWQNYHEQWLSEGFAQYFAALYAEHRRGPEVFGGIIRQMSQWASRMSPEGPVHLGYRLGHLKGDPRILRALIYNKGAMVLHMLRRLVGDEAFFGALRRFYRAHLFHKAGTEDVRSAFEQETGRDLSQFFDKWIYGWTLPSLVHTSRVETTDEGSAVQLQFWQREEVFEFPVTVRLRFRDGHSVDVVVPIREHTVQHRIPFTGSLRDVQVNPDLAAVLKR